MGTHTEARCFRFVHAIANQNAKTSSLSFGVTGRRARAWGTPSFRWPKNFTVVFYGLKIFCCKTAQFSETRRRSDSLGSPMKNTLCDAVKRCAIR